jgi:Protein of unknown function (DUF1071)
MNQLDLLKINVNDKTEKKNGMTYLSWAWAWTEVLKADQAATYSVMLWDDGTGLGKTPVMSIGDTGMVWVETTVFGKSLTCQLPILDYRNKPISHPDSMAVNTAIMRCLVKSLALHGLGLYIYSGEDTPDEEKIVTVTTPKATVEMTVPASAPIPAKVESTGSSVAAVEAPKGDWTDEDAAKIAETMLAFISVHRDLPDLNSYWKNNQVLLDRLKASHPETYNAIRNGFAEYKKTLQGADK